MSALTSERSPANTLLRPPRGPERRRSRPDARAIVLHGLAAWILLAAMVALPGDLSAQDERELGWSLEGELSSVFAGGNQTSRTFGAGVTIEWLGERSDFSIRGATVFQESGLRTRRAVGTVADFDVQEEERTEKTAESYNVRARYDYRFAETAYALAGADWLRNTFAGIDSRTLFALGVGNAWTDTDAFRFKTDVAMTYTFQTDVVENPFIKQNFPGVRGSYELLRTLTASTDFESELIVDWNLDETDDVRMDWRNAVPVSISSRLSLQPSLRLLWRNQPALTSVDLFDVGGAPTGESVLVPLHELDTFFTLALVVTL